jgi:2-polyprenyl-3-methyl-5-hydroxy-6-metoxy-1,4-benzoquinol methylase
VDELSNEYQSMPTGYYDQVFKVGLKRKKGLQYSWHDLKFSTVKNNFPSIYKTHLDIACGPGTFIGNYLDQRSIGIDIAKNQINYANKTYACQPTSFYVKDMYEVLNSDEKFDVITLLEFIEHIEPDEVNTLIKRLYFKLNKKGRIIITTPNYRGFWPILEKIISIKGPVDYRIQHINKYDIQRIKSELKYEKLKIKKYINFGIFFSVLNTKLGNKISSFINKFFQGYFGYSLIITIEK